VDGGGVQPGGNIGGGVLIESAGCIAIAHEVKLARATN
jgi:hypothetical protein